MAFSGVTPQQAGLDPQFLGGQGLKVGADGMVYTSGGSLYNPDPAAGLNGMTPNQAYANDPAGLKQYQNSAAQFQQAQPQGGAFAPAPLTPAQTNVNAFLQSANAPIIPLSQQQLGATPQMQPGAMQPQGQQPQVGQQGQQQPGAMQNQFNPALMQMPWLRQAMMVGQAFQPQQQGQQQMQGMQMPQGMGMGGMPGGSPQGGMPGSPGGGMPGGSPMGGLPNLPPVLSGTPNPSQMQPGFNSGQPRPLTGVMG